MRTGAHTLERSPAILAYDDARVVWGSWLTDGMQVDLDTARSATEDLLVSEHGQHPAQARFVAQAALNSVMEQATLERIGGIQ